MTEKLIQVKNDETVTTTLLVAEKFGKNHKNVISKIESLIADPEIGSILSRSNYFQKSEYLDGYGRPQPVYFMNRDGFTLLAMGFTGAEALRWKLEYIEAFNMMEKTIRSGRTVDHRLEIARLVLEAPADRVRYIRDLYPEYFLAEPERGSLEYVSDVNTSYQKWIEEVGITKDWIEVFPTTDVYRNYTRYCVENRLLTMGKKYFYRVLESDFGFTRKQKSDGYRYFLTA